MKPITDRQKFWIDASDTEAKKHSDNGLAGFFALLALPNDREQICEHRNIDNNGVCCLCAEKIVQEDK